MRRALLLVLLMTVLLTTGCAEVHSPSPDSGLECVDEDRDGVPAGPGCTGPYPDCDDESERVSPYADERCATPEDEDCDGIVDECCGGDCSEPPRPCGLGRCQGIQMRYDGSWSQCIPEIPPEPENCGPEGTGDGVDDDCDGEIDDGCLAP
ncbi:MAG: hypothetical protein SangKO_005010 [Sandaracinaceae bacterium]